ncbi:Reverse transcriptase (RNA-dependent DNA polymerase) [Popillia japonica]|uniref:Reverse transcriptase (RNA-dependent DNA polymerase) n=1 Tax=Popillia japonica TaxID=7064 RepID=A0AAW1N9H7_POPJA
MGLPFSNEKCNSCMKGKATRLPFKTATKPRSKRIGELLHSDICGPMFVSTKDEELYYLTIVDDFSHFCRVYLLKNKAEAKDYLVECIEELNASGNRVSRLRTDNGGEYTSKDLMDYCKKNGIKQEWTSSYTPQQGGVAERMNRSLRTDNGGEYTSKDLMDYCKKNGIKQEWTSSYTPQQGGVAERMNRSLLNKVRSINETNNGNEHKEIDEQERINAEMENAGEDDKRENTNVRKSSRERKQPEYLKDFLNEGEEYLKDFLNEGEIEHMVLNATSFVEELPTNLEEIKTRSDRKEWEGAIKEEMNSLKRNNTWTLVEKPKNIKLINSKWVFRIKRNQSGEAVKYKARLVAKGFMQSGFSELKEINQARL